MPLSLRVVACLCLPLLSAPAPAADPYLYLPGDAKLVVAVQFRKLLDAPLIDRDKPRTLRELVKKSPELLDVLGIRPLEDVASFLYAQPSVGEVRKAFVVVEGKFDPERIRQSIARIHKDTVKEHQAGGVTYQEFKVVVEKGQGVNVPEDVFVAAFADKCLITLGSKADLEAALAGKSAGLPAELRAELAKNDKEYLVSFALLPELKGPFAEMPQLRKAFAKLRSARGGVRIDEEIVGQVIASAADKKAAEELEDACQTGLNTLVATVAVLVRINRDLTPVLDVVKTIRASRKDNTVLLKGKVDRDVLEELLKKKKGS